MHLPRSFHQIGLYTSAMFSLFGNMLLILVVLHENCRRVLGSYRALLITFCIFDMSMSLVHAYVLPVYFQIDNGLLVFNLDTYHLSSDAGFLMNTLMATMFCQSFPLIMFHFLYRYFSIARPELIRNFFLRFVLSCILFFFCYNCLILYACWLTDKNSADHFFDAALLEEYGIDLAVPSAPRMFHLNYVHSPGGSWNGNSIIVIMIVVFAMSTTLTTNALCALGIVRALRNLSASEKSRKLQLQLFRALLVQFSVPCVLCVLPYSAIVFAPVVHRPLGWASDVIGMLVSIFPAVDPYLMLASMQKFRAILKEWSARASCAGNRVAQQEKFTTQFSQTIN